MDPSSFDVLTTAVLLLDGNHCIRHANTAAEEYFGLSRRQLEGLHADDLVKCAQSVLKVPLQGLSWAWLYEIPMRQTRFDDREQARVGQDAQRESLRNLAHEIKNPLGGLRAAAQLLEADLVDSRLRDYTQIIITETDRLVGLVDRLIKPQSKKLKVQRFNIHEVCEHVYTLLHAEFGQKVMIVRDYDASVPDITADFSCVLQVLLNLGRNAGQALTEGPVTIKPRLVLRTRVGHQLVLAHQQVRMGLIITVQDNGPGVPEALRDKVFHPLLTGRANGTGLGLSLAQELVQQQGGIIEFESEPGHTEFCVMLPLESR
ncbi:PAS domain-containing sensor histidine kinase [Alcaligenaceae bacterium CGII-47]|nr:PAS domain-containing sensor histidine kinase [Alcaligenaceae bacterium CGII-47]